MATSIITGTAGAIPGALGVAQTQACIVDFDWPTWQPTPSLVPPTPAREYINTSHTHYHFTPQRLSDEDVDRIARRVVELQREAGAKP